MKFKVVAILLIAANFTFTSMASGQQYGYGLYGGNQPCGYNNGPASGATSEDDDLADLIQQKKDLQADLRDIKKDIEGRDGLKKQVDELRDRLEKRFDPLWAEAFLLHMDHQNNCRICGEDIAPPRGRAYPQPPPPTYAPPEGKGGKGGDDYDTAPPQPQPVTPQRTGTPDPQPVTPQKSATPDPQKVTPQKTATPDPQKVTPQKTATPDPQAVTPQKTATPDPQKVTPQKTATPDPAKTVVVRPGPTKPTAPANLLQPKIDACVVKMSDTKKYPKAAKSYPTESARRQYCVEHGGDFSYNDVVPNNGRMPASVGSRMPASFGDNAPSSGESVGGASGANRRTAPGPVDAGADIPRDGWGAKADFDIGGGGGYSGGDTGPSNCYDRNTEPYMRRSWKGACRPHGELNPDICRTPGYLQDPSSTRDYYACQSDLKRYLKLTTDLQKQEEKRTAIENEIRDVKQEITDLKREKRRDRGDREDDAILEASASRHQKGGGGGSNGPSLGRTLLGLAAGVGVGYGLEAWNRSDARSGYNRMVSSNEALGWPSAPFNYQSNGMGIAAGMGVFSAIAGGQNGAFGCGQMYGGVNQGLFGNPYAQNPYATLGGGMYNGAGPWGAAGPWGYGQGQYGSMVGGMVGGLAGGMMGYPGMYAGGMAGYPGMYAGGIAGSYIGGIAGGIAGTYVGMAGGGYPGGYMGMSGGYPGGYIGMAGSYIGGIAGGIAGTYMGGLNGGYMGMAGGYMGAAGGYMGMAGGYMGISGGIVGGAGYQQQLMQMQMEQQQRAYATQQATAQQASTLQQKMLEIQMQLQSLSLYGSSSYQYPSTYGSTLSYDPSIYGSSILTAPTTTTIPTRTR